MGGLAGGEGRADSGVSSPGGRAGRGVPRMGIALPREGGVCEEPSAEGASAPGGAGAPRKAPRAGGGPPRPRTGAAVAGVVLEGEGEGSGGSVSAESEGEGEGEEGRVEKEPRRPGAPLVKGPLPRGEVPAPREAMPVGEGEVASLGETMSPGAGGGVTVAARSVTPKLPPADSAASGAWCVGVTMADPPRPRTGPPRGEKVPRRGAAVPRERGGEGPGRETCCCSSCLVLACRAWFSFRSCFSSWREVSMAWLPLLALAASSSSLEREDLEAAREREAVCSS